MRHRPAAAGMLDFPGHVREICHTDGFVFSGCNPIHLWQNAALYELLLSKSRDQQLAICYSAGTRARWNE
jgi:hypothetical protein